MVITNNEGFLCKPTQTTAQSIKEKGNDKTTKGKVQYIWVNRFSERETSRFLAAICDLLIQSLERDFSVKSPKTITLTTPDQGGIRIKIYGRD